MIKTRAPLAIVLTGVLLLAGGVRARASFEYTEIGPRATAMGGAAVSRNPHVTGLFYNPANLAEVYRPEVFAVMENLWQGLTDGSSISRQVLAVGYPLGKGKRGHLGVAMHTFGLSGIYEEKTTAIGYARGSGKNLRWGLGIHQMAISFGQDKYTAVNPTLKASNAASAMGMDFGILYRTQKNNQWGFSVINLNAPDLALAAANPVDRAVNIGFSQLRDQYEWHTMVQQTGGDMRFKTGFERWVRNRSWSLRAGFNLGSRDYRNFSTGFAYIRKHFQIDYAMLLPVGTVSASMGHQFGVTWRFGDKVKTKFEIEPGPEPGTGSGVGVATTTVKVDRPPIVVELARKEADKLVSSAMGLIDTSDYKGALTRLQKANDLPIDDPRYKALEVRVAAIARLKPVIKGGYAQSRLMRRGINALALGDGKTAIESLLYAKQTYPSDKDIPRMLELALQEFPDVGAQIKPLEGLTLVDQKLEEALSLIYSGRYTDAVALCEEVLQLDANNVLALVRQGSAYWALGRKQTARAVWKRALAIDPGNADVLEFLNRRDSDSPAPNPAGGPQTPAPPVKPPQGQGNIQKEYEEQVAYYQRLQRMNVNKTMLQMVLKQMLRKYEGSGIDMKYLRDEEKKY